ncbi:hypothetical protein [Paracoccus indicus]|uniref:hypothetical protein n=1 Tax=Paracoccus indicus TaxID=2079229 RepID=UPI001B8CE3CE|nr:hypothetical protein [Paracoccus indicus]
MMTGTGDCLVAICQGFAFWLSGSTALSARGTVIAALPIRGNAFALLIAHAMPLPISPLPAEYETLIAALAGTVTMQRIGQYGGILADPSCSRLGSLAQVGRADAALCHSGQGSSCQDCRHRYRACTPTAEIKTIAHETIKTAERSKTGCPDRWRRK